MINGGTRPFIRQEFFSEENKVNYWAFFSSEENKNNQHDIPVVHAKKFYGRKVTHTLLIEPRFTAVVAL